MAQSTTPLLDALAGIAPGITDPGGTRRIELSISLAIRSEPETRTEDLRQGFELQATYSSRRSWQAYRRAASTAVADRVALIRESTDARSRAHHASFLRCLSEGIDDRMFVVGVPETTAATRSGAHRARLSLSPILITRHEAQR